MYTTGCLVPLLPISYSFIYSLLIAYYVVDTVIVNKMSKLTTKPQNSYFVTSSKEDFTLNFVLND